MRVLVCDDGLVSSGNEWPLPSWTSLRLLEKPHLPGRHGPAEVRDDTRLIEYTVRRAAGTLRGSKCAGTQSKTEGWAINLHIRLVHIPPAPQQGVFRHDGSFTAAHPARRAVREHDCVLWPLKDRYRNRDLALVSSDIRESRCAMNSRRGTTEPRNPRQSRHNGG